MFVVKVNKSRYEYDVHSIVKAFFPKEDVKVLSPDIGMDKQNIWEEEVKLTVNLNEAGASLYFGTGEDYNWQIVKDSKEQRDAKAYKAAFKRFLYTSLVDYTGKELPWGNLTGIRPTKIAMELLEKGEKERVLKLSGKAAWYCAVDGGGNYPLL